MNLTVELHEDDADALELEDATAGLREALLETDAEAVERPRQAPPAGARAADAVTVGTLLVTVGPAALAAVTGVLQHWLARRGGRSVTLELDGDRLELGGVSAEEQQRLVGVFLERHGG